MHDVQPFNIIKLKNVLTTILYALFLQVIDGIPIFQTEFHF